MTALADKGSCWPCWYNVRCRELSCTCPLMRCVQALIGFATIERVSSPKAARDLVVPTDPASATPLVGRVQAELAHESSSDRIIHRAWEWRWYAAGVRQKFLEHFCKRWPGPACAAYPYDMDGNREAPLVCRLRACKIVKDVDPHCWGVPDCTWPPYGLLNVSH
jgi:hypothetical protein